MTRDLDQLLADYADDAVVFSPLGTFRGLEQVRGFFIEALKLLSPNDLASLNVSKQEYEGEFAYVLWSAGAAIPFAGDSFCVRNGKIVMHSFAAQLGF
jgi:ketosteroid isomerase-like protein